jgi:hypothetical protein
MPRIKIPKNSGHFSIGIAYAGNYIVTNDKSGGNSIVIPCRDKEQAEELCKKLNAKEHNGEIWY